MHNILTLLCFVAFGYDEFNNILQNTQGSYFVIFCCIWAQMDLTMSFRLLILHLKATVNHVSFMWNEIDWAIMINKKIKCPSLDISPDNMPHS